MNIFKKKSQKKLAVITLLFALTINLLISPLCVLAGSYLNELNEVVSDINSIINTSNSFNDSKKESCENEKYCLSVTEEIKSEINAISSELNALVSNGISLDELVSKSGATITNYSYLSTQSKNKIITYQNATEIEEEFVKKEASCSVTDKEGNQILDKDTCESYEGVWENEEKETILITIDDIENMFLSLLKEIKDKTNLYGSLEKYNETYDNKVIVLRTKDKTKALESKEEVLAKISSANTELDSLNQQFSTFNEENPDFKVENANQEQLESYLNLQKSAYNLSNKNKDIKDSYNSFMNNQDYSYAYQDDWEEFTSDLTSSYNTFIEKAKDYENKEAINDKINFLTDIDNLNAIEQTKTFLENFKANLKTNFTMVSEENIKKIDKKLLNTYYVLKSSTDNIVIDHTSRIVKIMTPKLSTNEILANLDIDFKDNILFDNTVNLIDSEENQIITVKTDSLLEIKDTNESSVGKYSIVVNGDITSDANVDGNDLQELENLVLGNKKLSDFITTKLLAADYSNDDSYNIVDIVLLYQRIALIDSGVEE